MSDEEQVSPEASPSTLEKQLSNKPGGDGDSKMKLTKKVSVKKVRLTPSKILSMVVGDKKNSKAPGAPAASGEDIGGDDAGEAESGVPVRPGKKKKAKKDVKEAIFGPGDFKRKIKKRGSSSENDGNKEKKTKRRKRRGKDVPKEEKPKTPPPPEEPKEKTPPPPEPPQEPTTAEEPVSDKEEPEKEPEKEKTPPKEPTPPPPKEPTPKEPTPPPPKEPTPKEPTPPPQEDVKSATPEPPQEENDEKQKEPSPIPIKKSKKPTPPPAPEGPPSDTDEDVLPESKFFETPTPSGNSLSNACPIGLDVSLQKRLLWILLLIYRGPIRLASKHILRRTVLPQLILGPTIDTLLFEYINLLLDAADKFIRETFPDLHLETVGDLMKDDEDEGDEGDEGDKGDKGDGK